MKQYLILALLKSFMQLFDIRLVGFDLGLLGLHTVSFSLDFFLQAVDLVLKSLDCSFVLSDLGLEIVPSS